jgi:TfoX/Sxy family transcriptional regulator of competence genes
LSSVLPAINHRPMFGGVGLYSRGLFFALIAGGTDTLFMYTDASNRADYEALGMETFGVNYYQLPIGVLEDPEELREWAQKSVAAAAKKHRKPSRGAARAHKPE